VTVAVTMKVTVTGSGEAGQDPPSSWTTMTSTEHWHYRQHWLMSEHSEQAMRVVTTMSRRRLAAKTAATKWRMARPSIEVVMRWVVATSSGSPGID
jgi:hypothetical protein